MDEMNEIRPEPSPENLSKAETDRHIRGVIEALLFVSEKPVEIEQIRKVLVTVSAPEIKATLAAMKVECESEQRGMNIVEIAGGYQMLSNPKYAQSIRDFYKTKHREKLSKPALECLAVIAYKQPVTRMDIELVRGVNSDGVVTHLLDKELIKIIGRKDVPGKPYLYGTTKQFLEYFGLRSIEDLPKLEEYEALLAKSEPTGILPVEGEGTMEGEAKAEAEAKSENAIETSAAEISTESIPQGSLSDEKENPNESQKITE